MARRRKGQKRAVWLQRVEQLPPDTVLAIKKEGKRETRKNTAATYIRVHITATLPDGSSLLCYIACFRETRDVMRKVEGVLQGRDTCTARELLQARGDHTRFEADVGAAQSPSTPRVSTPAAASPSTPRSLVGAFEAARVCTPVAPGSVKDWLRGLPPQTPARVTGNCYAYKGNSLEISVNAAGQRKNVFISRFATPEAAQAAFGRHVEPLVRSGCAASDVVRLMDAFPRAAPTRATAAPRRQTHGVAACRPILLVDLFCGSKSVRRWCARHLSHLEHAVEHFSVDVDPGFDPTAVLDLTVVQGDQVYMLALKRMVARHPDNWEAYMTNMYVFASPPCNKFSQARATAPLCTEMNDACTMVVCAVRFIVHAASKHGIRGFCMENPDGRKEFALSKLYFMRPVDCFRTVVNYCMYGFTVAKQTNMWTSSAHRGLRCEHGIKHSETVKGLPYAMRGAVPEDLLQALFDGMDDADRLQRSLGALRQCIALWDERGLKPIDAQLVGYDDARCSECLDDGEDVLICELCSRIKCLRCAALPNVPAGPWVCAVHSGAVPPGADP